MKVWLAVLIIPLALAVTSADDSSLNSLAEANNQLALELHRALAAEDKGNIFISTLSISAVLAMLMHGARKDTQEELYRYLGYQDAGLSVNGVHLAFKQLLEKLNSAKGDYDLLLANAILAQKDFPINDKYKDDLKSLYYAKVENVDFKADNAGVVKNINKWVNDVTMGAIESLVESLDEETVVVLLNAIYFKGTWEKEFDPKETRSLAFHNHGQRFDQKQVHMMQREDTFRYIHLSGVSAIELPYEGKEISMVILIPDELNGITKLEGALTPNIVSDLRKMMRKTKLRLFLPKFKIEYKQELSAVLQKIGIKKIFQKGADLSGISSSGNLEVSRVNHKAVIEVNEEGSEAAGVTDVEVSFRMGGLNVLVDRPFLFAIVDTKTDMMLFQGRITEF